MCMCVVEFRLMVLVTLFICVCLVSDPWRWVMAWKDIMPLAPMVTILDKAFFPKWLQVGATKLRLKRQRERKVGISSVSFVSLPW